MGRFKHVNDVEQKDDGSLVYTGGLYEIYGDANERKRTLLSFIVGTVLLAGLILLSGCINADNATKSFTVIIPLVGEVSAAFVICWQAAKLIAGKGTVRNYVLDAMSEKIPAACKVLVVFAMIGMAFSVIYLFQHGTGGELLKSLAYPVMKGLIASTAIGYEKFFHTIRWVKA